MNTAQLNLPLAMNLIFRSSVATASKVSRYPKYASYVWLYIISKTVARTTCQEKMNQLWCDGLGKVLLLRVRKSGCGCGRKCVTVVVVGKERLGN